MHNTEVCSNFSIQFRISQLPPCPQPLSQAAPPPFYSKQRDRCSCNRTCRHFTCSGGRLCARSQATSARLCSRHMHGALAHAITCDSQLGSCLGTRLPCRYQEVIVHACAWCVLVQSCMAKHLEQSMRQRSRHIRKWLGRCRAGRLFHSPLFRATRHHTSFIQSLNQFPTITARPRLSIISCWYQDVRVLMASVFIRLAWAPRNA